MAYSQPASQLINHAHSFAQRRGDPAVDLLHILLAAVRDPRNAGHAGNILMQYLRNEHDRWSLLIEYELDIRPPQAASRGYKSTHLDWYERNWDRWMAARSGWMGITCSLMLATILAFEPTQEKMARRCGIDRDGLIRALATRALYAEDGPGNYGGLGTYGAPGDYGRPGDFGGLGDFGAPGVWTVPDQMPTPFQRFPPISGEVPVAVAPRPSALQRFSSPVASTPKLLYARLHHPTAIEVISHLSSNPNDRRMCVLAGMRGTPIEVMERLLADRLAQVHAPMDPLARGQQGIAHTILRDFSSVHTVQLLRIIQAMDQDRNEVDQIPVLLQEAANQRIILVIDRLELLASTHIESDIREKIIAELSKAGSIPLIGLYHLGEHEAFDREKLRLGIRNAVSMEIPPESQEQTTRELKEFFLPHWLERGYTFHKQEGAFEWLFKLAPALRVDTSEPSASQDERKWLPYAVIDLGRETIDMIANAPSEATVRDIAERASKTLSEINVEALAADMREVLREAKDEIRRLAKDPKLHQNRSHTQMELTRAHLMAQLFYPSGTQFRPVAPKPEDSVPAYQTSGTVERHHL